MIAPDQTSIKTAQRNPVEAFQLAFVLAAVLVPALVPSLLWWPAALAPLVFLYALMAARLPGLRRAPGWLRAGRLNRGDFFLTVVVTLASCAVLLAWKHAAHPKLSDYLARVPDRAPALLVAACLTFALINASVEEAVFRGLLQTLLEERSGPAIAIVVQAILFGLGHYAGVPRGWAGVGLATLYGLVLGLLRHRTGGLGACILSHIAVDATIFSMVVWNL